MTLQCESNVKLIAALLCIHLPVITCEVVTEWPCPVQQYLAELIRVIAQRLGARLPWQLPEFMSIKRFGGRRIRVRWVVGEYPNVFALQVWTKHKM